MKGIDTFDEMIEMCEGDSVVAHDPSTDIQGNFKVIQHQLSQFTAFSLFCFILKCVTPYPPFGAQ